MKTLFTILALLIVSISVSYGQEVNGQVTMEDVQLRDVKISVTVDSAEEIEEAFQITDIRSLLKEVGDNEEVSFELVCNGEAMTNGELSSLTYKIEGNTNNIKDFINHIKKVRQGAIKYYKNKE